MATYAKTLLSGSTGGRQIKVAATATPGTLIHTTGSTSGALDEVWLYVVNNDTVYRTLTLEFGGTTSVDDLITLDVPPRNGLVLIVPGLVLSTSLSIRAFAAAANVLCISGFVNRITP